MTVILAVVLIAAAAYYYIVIREVKYRLTFDEQDVSHIVYHMTRYTDLKTDGEEIIFKDKDKETILKGIRNAKAFMGFMTILEPGEDLNFHLHFNNGEVLSFKSSIFEGTDSYFTFSEENSEIVWIAPLGAHVKI